MPQAEALVYRPMSSTDYDEGALHDFLITYEGGKPAMMGGSVKKAKEHFDRALVLNKGCMPLPTSITPKPWMRRSKQGRVRGNAEQSPGH